MEADEAEEESHCFPGLERRMGMVLAPESGAELGSLFRRRGTPSGIAATATPRFDFFEKASSKYKKKDLYFLLFLL